METQEFQRLGEFKSYVHLHHILKGHFYNSP